MTDPGILVLLILVTVPLLGWAHRRLFPTKPKASVYYVAGAGFVMPPDIFETLKRITATNDLPHLDRGFLYPDLYSTPIYTSPFLFKDET